MSIKWAGQKPQKEFGVGPIKGTYTFRNDVVKEFDGVTVRRIGFRRHDF